MMTTRPTLGPTESFDSYCTRLDAWKAEGNWIPASCGTEQPFRCRSGATLLYCYQPRSGQHAYLDYGTDLILSAAEAMNLMGLS